MKLQKLVLGLAVTLALVGCGKATPSTNTPATVVPSGSASEPLSGTASIVIDNFATTPTTLFVKKGTVVTVTNNDIAGHSLTASDGSFDTGVLGKGKSATLTMNSVGTFKFHCTPHPTTSALQGTITVVE